MRTSLILPSMVIWGLVSPVGARVAASEDTRSGEVFANLDASRDGELSADEYLRSPGNREMHLRDLALFDFDGDGALSPEEFAAIPGSGPVQLRGALPDPFEPIVEAAVAAMDESYNGWDRRPDELIFSRTFVDTFIESLAGQDQRSFTVQAAQADTNSDGRVSRDEARAFLELHLGVRSPRGDPLAQPNGRVLNWTRFPWLDADKDDQITLKEYCDKVKPNGEISFQLGDSDHDGAISWDEYANPKWINGHEDPIVWFRNADKNLDGLVDSDELTQATPAWRHSPLAHNVDAFDDDGDGKWSLDEYRRSPNGNYLCSWEAKRTDTDRDRKLSFSEFLFDKVNFLLLQRMYFARLDHDGDGLLDRHEFVFTVQPAHAIYRLTVDGSKFERLWIDEDCPNGGSPEISPDNRTILFDDYPRRMIVAVDLETGTSRDVCTGIMPSWSPDGMHFACCRDEGGLGFWIVPADGSRGERIADGWGAQWSPDGTRIAYMNFQGGIGVYDVETKQTRDVLKLGEHPYEDFYWGMSWSPDSRRIASRVDRPAGQPKGAEIVSVDVVGPSPDLQVHYSTDHEIINAVAWSPDGRRLVFDMRTPEQKQLLLHQVDLTTGAATVLPGIDADLLYLDCAFSPDGQSLIMMAR